MTNDNNQVSDSWDTPKAVMRGHIISLEAAENKNSNSRLLVIENWLPTLEQAFRNFGSHQDYKNILKLEYNSIGKRFENLLLKPKQKHSDLGDKSELY